MVVQCEECRSKFNLDDAKIPAGGLKVRCSKCSHIFMIRKEAPKGAAAKGVSGAATSSPRTSAFDFSVFTTKNETGSIKPSFDLSAAGTKSEIGSIQTPATQAKTPPSSPETSQTGSSLKWGNIDLEKLAPAEKSSSSASAGGFNFGGKSDSLFPGNTSQQSSYSSPKAADRETIQSAGPRHQETPRQPERTSFNWDNNDSHNRAAEPGHSSSSSMDAGFAFGAKASGTFSEPRKEETYRPPRQELIIEDKGNPLKGMAPRAVSSRDLTTILEDKGLTDEYVVQKVHEVCEATRFVEGHEKPDWPIRVIGIDMLCKIKGLYKSDKKDDLSNKQLQIVTGINMKDIT